MTDDTCDIHQAGDILKVHPETVLDLIAKGDIPAGRIGRAYVMLRKDVIAYVSKRIATETAQRMGGGPKAKKPRRKRVLPEFVG
jgi:excisionase family DNA binding protein